MMMVLTADDKDNEECSDYTLNQNSCWISVGDVSIYIYKTPTGVVVEAYSKDNDSLGRIEAPLAVGTLAPDDHDEVVTVGLDGEMSFIKAAR